MFNAVLFHLRTSSVALFMSSLIACGGGGSGGGFITPPNDNSGGGGAPASAFSLSITSQTPNNEESVQVTSERPLEISVALTSNDGSAVNNQIIELVTEIATVAPSNGSAITNEDGVASFVLTFNGTEGAGSVTASYSANGTTVEATYNIESILIGADYTLAITTTDTSGATSSSVSAEEPLLVRVQLKDGATPLQNRVVKLQSDNGLVTVSPQNGAALSDANGEASFKLLYGGQTGAETITATFDGPDASTMSQAAIESILTPLELGSLDDNGDFVDNIIRVEPSSAVGYQGSVQLLLAVGDLEGNRVTSTQTARIESPCVLNGFSELDGGTLVELENGVGSLTYQAGDGCSGTTDIVTATLLQEGNNSPATAIATLDISAAPAADEHFISFVSATPSNIALAGTGGGSSLEERAQVVFEVRDGSGNAVAGQTVTFELSRSVGGIQLSDVLATTDSNGQVTATVISGSVATPVRVIATTERSPADANSNLVSVISDSLTISSGIVTQARFSLGAEVLNLASAAVVGGITDNIVVTAYDRFGNAVPNGTAVSFTTQCGGIVNTSQTGVPAGSCEIIDGSCTMEWRSQPAASVTCPDNRVTIMAHALGEEDFADVNSDGYFNSGESFTDNSEAYRDDNESGAYEFGEQFIDLDTDGVFTEATPSANAPSGLFNGVACGSDSSVCSNELISVYANLEIVAGPQDASALDVSVTDAFSSPLTPGVDPMGPGSYVVVVSDANGNLPPFGTVISAEGAGECEVTSPEVTAPNSNAVSELLVGVNVIANGPNDENTDDRVTVSITIPESVGGSDNAATLTFACNP